MVSSKLRAVGSNPLKYEIEDNRFLHAVPFECTPIHQHNVCKIRQHNVALKECTRVGGADKC